MVYTSLIHPVFVFPPSLSLPSSYSSPPPAHASTKYEPAPPPTNSSSPVRYDRGTPVRGVSYAAFPPLGAVLILFHACASCRPLIRYTKSAHRIFDG
ncbi:hypothetical protein C8R44DRAFT_774394 [Mycena epipterygia]|nr:hypothetical protein C8R44DRAFT_774394 [Mycena epipterygia]